MNTSDRKGIVAFFAANPVAANLLMLLILTAGIFTAMGLRKEGFPNIPPSRVTISVTYQSGSASQAEQGIAVKIEETLKDVEGLEKITSTSDGQGVTVTVKKKSDADIDSLFSDIKTKVDGIASFPAEAEKPVITKQKREEHVIWVQVFGNAAQDTLQEIARGIRRDMLLKSGVTKVDIAGERSPVIAIEVDDTQLRAYGLTIEDIATAVGSESLTETSGELRSSENTIKLEAALQRYHYRDFADITFNSRNDGSTVRLEDIAAIIDGYEESPAKLSRFQGKPSIGLQVTMGDNGDIGVVAEQVLQVVEKWNQSSRVPQGISIATWYDQSNFIKERLRLLIKNGVTGVILIAFALALFLNVKVAFWVAAGIPVCIAGTLFCMGEGMLGMSLNELTTFGFILALGIMVDDAVVIGESVYTTRKEEGDTVDGTIRGVKKVAVPTVFGVLTTIAAFYPLSLIEGNMGKILSQFAIIVVICLLFSLVESKLILPAHLSHLDTRTVNQKWWALPWNRLQEAANKVLEFITDKIYMPVLRLMLRYRYGAACLFFTIFVLVCGMALSGKVRFVFFPDFPGDVVTAKFTLYEETGYGLGFDHAMTLEKAAMSVNDELMKKHNIKEPVVTNLQTRVTDDRTGQVIADLNQDSGVSVEEFTSYWRDTAGTLEGTQSLKFSSSMMDMDSLRIELLSDSTDQLMAAGACVRKALSEIPGVRDIQDDLTSGQSRISLRLNDSGRALGFTTADLAKQIRQGFYGYEVQRFQRGENEVKVKVRFPVDKRRDMGDLLQSYIRTPDGTAVPLSAVADLSSGYTISEINRLHGMRTTVISADVDKDRTSPAEALAHLQSSLFSRLERDYPGLSIYLGGEAEEQAESQKSMTQVFCLALLVIYILLAVPLGSYSQPILIMMAIPFGVVGAIIGHWWTGLALSFFSLKGMLALSGVVVNDSLLLVSRYNRLREEGISVNEALTKAGTSRIRAILLTSLTTYLGLVPLLNETSTQAQFLIPAVTSLAYGILFGTLITLLIIPILLRIREDLVWKKKVPAPMIQQEKKEAVAWV